jgi:hypothetical protein
MNMNKILTCSFSIVLSISANAANNSDAIMMDGRPCLDISSPIERLACFEEQARAAQGSSNSVPQQNLPVVSLPNSSNKKNPTPSLEVESHSTTESRQGQVNQVTQETNIVGLTSAEVFESNFGMPSKNDVKENASANELISNVAKLQELDRNRFRITLENGQVWEQMETRRFVLVQGDEVRIYPTRWGNSYRLSSSSHKGFIQVQRLR